MKRAGIRVAGIVQGVGFRPFVYRLAHKYQLNGWVLNDEKGVWIEVEGSADQFTQFITAVKAEAPAMAMIADLQVISLPVQGDDAFVIKPSPVATKRFAFISPDIATCPDCQSELQNPVNRRFGYAFTNCTNCGPRYSIIKDVPYDRPQTTMQPFAMCADCQAEYDVPTDRRFHAQPNACAICGPSYRLLNSKGQELLDADPLKTAHQLIKNGAVFAVKGIGGYHLVCDAKNETAVATLRSRKVREDKPFALMCGSLAKV
ncbi:MAG: Acylphosphatase, partial [Massilibacillus sp.]|nr:Acylphosphatase [Massilibacillus sp.]